MIHDLITAFVAASAAVLASELLSLVALSLANPNCEACSIIEIAALTLAIKSNAVTRGRLNLLLMQCGRLLLG
jgi:hypothetical protein